MLLRLQNGFNLGFNKMILETAGVLKEIKTLSWRMITRIAIILMKYKQGQCWCYELEKWNGWSTTNRGQVMVYKRTKFRYTTLLSLFNDYPSLQYAASSSPFTYPTWPGIAWNVTFLTALFQPQCAYTIHLKEEAATNMKDIRRVTLVRIMLKVEIQDAQHFQTVFIERKIAIDDNKIGYRHLDLTRLNWDSSRKPFPKNRYRKYSTALLEELLSTIRKMGWNYPICEKFHIYSTSILSRNGQDYIVSSVKIRRSASPIVAHRKYGTFALALYPSCCREKVTCEFGERRFEILRTRDVGMPMESTITQFDPNVEW